MLKLSIIYAKMPILLGILSQESIHEKEQINALLSKNRDSLKDFHVKSISLFGSVAREEQKESSDVDLLVEFDPEAHIGLFEFARLQGCYQIYWLQGRRGDS